MIRRRLPDWFPRGRNAVILMVAMLVGAFGTGMFLAGSTIFFTTAAGLTKIEFGVGLAIASGVGLFAALPVGSVADWAGPKRVLVVVYLWRSVWFVVLAFTTGPVWFTVAASAQAAAQQCSTPILQALIGTVTEDKNRTRTMALIRSIRNVGFGLGALAAAPLTVADSIWLNRLILIGTGATLLVSGLVLTMLRVGSAAARVAARNPFAGLKSITDWRYLGMAVSNGVLALHMTLLAVGLPLWIVALPDVSNAFAAVIVFVNTVIVVVAQVPFSKGVDNPASARRAIWLGSAALAACCLALAVSALADNATLAAGVVLLAGVLLTCGELWQAVGSWELSFSLAPEASRSSYLGVFSLGVTVQEMLGPLIVGGLVIANGGVGWVSLAALFGIGAFATTTFAKRISRRRAAAEVALG